MRYSHRAKAVVTSVAIGVLLVHAAVSFVGFRRGTLALRDDDSRARLAEVELSPDGRWIALYAWRGESGAQVEAAGSFLVDLDDGSLRALPGARPAADSWSDDGLLRLRTPGDGELRWLDPRTLATVRTERAGEQDRRAAVRPEQPLDWRVLRLADERLLVRSRTTLELRNEQGALLRTLFPRGLGPALRAGL